jgi:hypothetical protein
MLPSVVRRATLLLLKRRYLLVESVYYTSSEFQELQVSLRLVAQRLPYSLTILVELLLSESVLQKHPLQDWWDPPLSEWWPRGTLPIVYELQMRSQPW